MMSFFLSCRLLLGAACPGPDSHSRRAIRVTSAAAVTDTSVHRQADGPLPTTAPTRHGHSQISVTPGRV